MRAALKARSLNHWSDGEVPKVISDCKIRGHEYSERIFNVFFSPNLNLEGSYSVRAENKGKEKKRERRKAFSIQLLVDDLYAEKTPIYKIA